MGRAEAKVLQVQESIEALHDELDEKLDQLNDKYDVAYCEIETFSIKPRKTDIDIKALCFSLESIVLTMSYLFNKFYIIHVQRV